MMKKRLLFILSLLALICVLLSFKSNPAQAADKYGIARQYTTPVATRGRWYYLDRYSGNKKKLRTLRITAHTAAGAKLYVPSQQYFKKHVYYVSAKKRHAFIRKTSHLFAAYSFRGGFNVNNWVNLAGDGEYYLPATKKVKGKKVAVLKLATGAGPMVYAIAYKTKALAKRAK